MKIDPRDRKRVETRFYSKVRKTHGCWEWLGPKSQTGYGSFCLNGKARGAHRAAWEIFVGEIPEGLVVCHRCDNPGCARPSHLFLGTHQENMTDKMLKGRAPRGRNHWTRRAHAA